MLESVLLQPALLGVGRLTPADPCVPRSVKRVGPLSRSSYAKAMESRGSVLRDG